METLSVLLPTFNEASKLRRCLESVKWADEILVVDSFSTDGTLDIAREYGARIIQHEYINSATQKNWAIPQCRCDWILQIDADEVMEPLLAGEIREVLAHPDAGVDGYWIPFKHHMLGQWLKTMDHYPAPQLRFFRRVGRFQDREVDARVVVPGKVGNFKNHILHYGVDNISQRLRGLDRYTRYEADERFKQGRKFTVTKLVVRSIGCFCYLYFWKLGFTQGIRGLLLCAHRADFVFWTYAKLWEKSLKSQTGPI